MASLIELLEEAYSKGYDNGYHNGGYYMDGSMLEMLEVRGIDPDMEIKEEV